MVLMITARPEEAREQVKQRPTEVKAEAPRVVLGSHARLTADRATTWTHRITEIRPSLAIFTDEIVRPMTGGHRSGTTRRRQERGWGTSKWSWRVDLDLARRDLARARARSADLERHVVVLETLLGAESETAQSSAPGLTLHEAMAVVLRPRPLHQRPPGLWSTAPGRRRPTQCGRDSLRTGRTFGDTT